MKNKLEKIYIFLNRKRKLEKHHRIEKIRKIKLTKNKFI